MSAMAMSSILPPPAVLTALLFFAMVMSITPGPNNLMLTASGVNFGIRRTVPHMIGIWLGCVTVMLAVGLGLGAVFSAFPAIRIAIQIAGMAFILYLAWKVATAGTLGSGDAAHRHPFPLPAAVAFQWVNPKLWVMTISAMAIYVRPDHAISDVALVTGIFACTNIPSMLIWAGFGAVLRDFLQAPGRIRIFNIVMGVLLAGTVVTLIHR